MSRDLFRYCQWGGNPKGTLERADQCIAEVPVGARSPLFHQCSRKRGKGPRGEFCGQHAAAIKCGRWPFLPESSYREELEAEAAR